MGTRERWISGLFVVATGAVVWSALDTKRENAPVSETRREMVAVAEAGPRASGAPVTVERTEVLAEPDKRPPTNELPREPDVTQARPASRSPLAMDLDNVAFSFLTRQPRATDLLDLVEQLASRAVVEPDSVKIQRNQEGGLSSARGVLAIGDLRGTFQVDPDGYHVEFTSAVDDPAWSRRDIHITFEEGDSGPRGCHATVQFHPQAVEPDSGARAPDGEMIVGWSVGTSLETGTRASPLTLIAEGDGWTIGGSERVQAQEFSWVSATGGFDAWLRLLKSCTVR